jgi:hypothetical protein
VDGRTITSAPFVKEIWKQLHISSRNAPMLSQSGHLLQIGPDANPCTPSQWTNELDIEDWFSQLLERGDKLVHTLAILTCWSIWKQRNAVIFRENRRPAHMIFEEIKTTCITWSGVGGKVLQRLTVAINHSV